MAEIRFAKGILTNLECEIPKLDTSRTGIDAPRLVQGKRIWTTVDNHVFPNDVTDCAIAVVCFQVARVC
jgi:hypothetical protein